MADTKVTALTELTTPAGGDLLYIVDDPAGTPLSRKVTVTNLFANASPITVASGGSASVPAFNGTDSNSGIFFVGNNTRIAVDGTEQYAFQSDAFSLRSTGIFAWSNSGSASGTIDLYLIRDAANTLALRNGTNAQTFRNYGTYTDASNYRRLALTMSTSGVAEIKPEGAGTGASGNVLHISGLPTSNPGPGILWNNAGTPAIGT